MYKEILNKVYQSTFRKLVESKENYANKEKYQVTSRAFVQGKISAYSEVIALLKCLSEEVKKESSD